MKMKMLGPAVAAAGMLFLSTTTQAQQESGVVGSPPPEDMFLEVTTGPNGEPVLSQDTFTMSVGGYYRFNFICPDAQDDVSGFNFEAVDLISNSHLRVFSVGDMELYLQGLTFRAIQCDEAGAARFSFHPMRRGVYDLYVSGGAGEASQEVYGQFIVE